MCLIVKGIQYVDMCVLGHSVRAIILLGTVSHMLLITVNIEILAFVQLWCFPKINCISTNSAWNFQRFLSSLYIT